VKPVEAEIEKWAKELFLIIYPNTGFPLDASTILTENERTKNIKDMDDLRIILGQWCFMDQYGSTLLKVLEDASRKHNKSSSNKARVKEKRNPNQPIEPTLQGSVTASLTSSRKRFPESTQELSCFRVEPVELYGVCYMVSVCTNRTPLTSFYFVLTLVPQN
jgi:hypothetical protein